MQAIFGGAMALGGVLTIISSIYYWIMIGLKKREKKTFHMILISILLACEVGAILASFVQFAIPKDTTLAFCSLARSVFLFSSFSSLFLTSLLALTLLHLAFLGTSIPSPTLLLELSTEKKIQVIFFFAFEGLALLFLLVDILLSDNFSPCLGSEVAQWIYWGAWILTTLFNFTSLGFILYNVHKITMKTNQDRRAIRAVLSVSLIFGILRFPTFVFRISSPESASEILSQGMSAKAIGVIVVDFLNVLQGFFVVLVVGTVQGLFAWCCGKCCSCCSSFSDSSSPSGPSGPSSAGDQVSQQGKNRNHSNPGRKELAHEESDLEMRTF